MAKPKVQRFNNSRILAWRLVEEQRSHNGRGAAAKEWKLCPAKSLPINKLL